MCECGCGSNYDTFSLKGPGDIVYILEFGHGCPECETPAGVIISERRVADITDQNELPPELPMNQLPSWNGNVRREAAVAIADPHEVYELAFKTICDGFGVNDWSDWPEAFAVDPSELHLKTYELFRKMLRKSMERLASIA